MVTGVDKTTQSYPPDQEKANDERMTMCVDDNPASFDKCTKDKMTVNIWLKS